MILALETSTRRASLALLDSGSRSLVAERSFETERAHNAAIFEPLAELLDLAGERLQRLVVGLGPGSYGGVRVGIAVATGIALVRGIPVEGVSSLRAWDVPEASYHLLGDARRRSYLVATVRDRELAGGPELVEEADLPARLEGLRESPWPLYTAEPALAAALESQGLALGFPSAARLGLLAGELPPPLHAPPLEPHYLRAPYITEPKEPKAR